MRMLRDSHSLIQKYDDKYFAPPEDYKSSYIIHIKRCKHCPNVGVRCIRQIPQAKKLLELVVGEKSRRALSHELSVPLMTLTSL